MKKIRYYWARLLKLFLAIFGISTVPCGVEVTDQAVRVAYLHGASWEFVSVRLEEGILIKGKLKDRERFLGALVSLKEKMVGFEGKNKKVDATLVIGEAAVYNHVFNLPMVEGENLKNAITLNMQMASPMASADSYSGWQIVGRDTASSRLDVLGTFAERGTVDDISLALFEAGFISVAVESKALALARIFRKQTSGIDLTASYVLLDIDDAGFAFLIIRGGQLYFEYATAWSDLADDKGLISIEKFKDALRGSLRQVMNFYLQHWNDKIAGVIVSAVALLDDTQKIVSGEFEMPVIPFSPDACPTATPEWFVALGAGLREAGGAEKDHEVNLLGPGAQDVFTKDRVLSFAGFWSVFLPIASLLLIVVFVLANLFMSNIEAGAAAKPVTALTAAESAAMATLTASSTDFNRSSGLIAGIEGSTDPKYAIVQDIEQAASTNNVTISRLSFPGMGSPTTVAGQANSESDILAFKDALAGNARFTSINLPVTNIQSAAGAYTFSLSVMLSEATGTEE